MDSIKENVSEPKPIQSKPVEATEQQIIMKSTISQPSPSAITPHLNDDICEKSYNYENQFEPNTAKLTVIDPVPSLTMPSLPTCVNSSATDNFADILSNWDNICQMNNDDAIEDAMHSLSDAAATFTGEDDLKMWFWDAWVDPVKAPGHVYLFGKVACQGSGTASATQPEYKSTCLRLEQVERCIYLLPRDFHLDPISMEKTKRPVKFVDVYKEFDEKIASALQLKTFKSKDVKKNFAFLVPDVKVPSCGKYLEVSVKEVVYS